MSPGGTCPDDYKVKFGSMAISAVVFVVFGGIVVFVAFVGQKKNRGSPILPRLTRKIFAVPGKPFAGCSRSGAAHESG